MASAAATEANNDKLLSLIDVDCNLWHKDLQGIAKSLGHDDIDYFSILQVDALHRSEDKQKSNVIAMLSPSSTLKEAADGLEHLKQAVSNEKDKEESNSISVHGIAIRTTVGVHPYHVNDDEFHKDKSAKEYIEHDAKDMIQSNLPYVTAIGECGLDASEGFPPIEDQIPWFQAQIDLCQDHFPQLALFVHERLAFDQTMKMLQSSSIPPSKIIIHCFTGTVEECKAYIDQGYSISVSGYIFRSDEQQQQSVTECLELGIIPLDKLMIETDAPYMGFVGSRQALLDRHADYIQTSLNAKKRKKLTSSLYPNVPSSLTPILYKVLEHINIGRTKRGEEILTAETLATQTTRNANYFFQFGLQL